MKERVYRILAGLRHLAKCRLTPFPGSHFARKLYFYKYNARIIRIEFFYLESEVNMSLRDKQIGGLSLPQPMGFIVHGLSSFAVFLLSYYFWLNKVIEVPEELRVWLSFGSTVPFFLSLFGMIQEGYVGALLWNGTYTDDSYSGLYCTPKPPFPIVLLVLKVFAPGIYDKLFWSIGGILSVQDIAVPITSQVLSSDGVRLKTETTLVFELQSAARFLIQTSNNTETSSLFQAVTSLYSASMKSSSLSSYTAQEIHVGVYQKDQDALVALLMKQFDFVKNYGLILAKIPIVKIVIESQKMEKVFDQVAASGLLDLNASRLRARVALLKQDNPDMDDLTIYALLQSSSGEDSSLDIHSVRVK